MNTGRGEITGLDWTPNKIRIETDGGGGMLMLNINFDRGWIRIGESLSDPENISGILGVSLSAGTEEVELEYRPRSFYWGAAISTGALALWVLAWYKQERTELEV